MNNIDKTIIPKKEYDIKKIALESINWGKYILSKWIYIGIFTFISLSIGIILFKQERPKYTSRISYILVNGQTNDLNSSNGISGFLGLSGDNSAQDGGLFSASNLNVLFTSEFLLTKVLNRTVLFKGDSISLADAYLKINKKINLEKAISNNTSQDNDYNTIINKRRGVINNICKSIVKESLLISPRKGTSFTFIEFSSLDEDFSLLFLQNLMEIVSDFYIESQVKKIKETCIILKNQKDSIKQVLDYNLYNVANINDKFINANASYKQKISLPSQKSQIEVQATQAIYLQLIQNLNSQELKLRNQTPLIQIIDAPMLPLEVKLPERNSFLINYFFLGLIISIVFFILKKVIQDFLKEIFSNE